MPFECWSILHFTYLLIVKTSSTTESGHTFYRDFDIKGVLLKLQRLQTNIGKKNLIPVGGLLKGYYRNREMKI